MNQRPLNQGVSFPSVSRHYHSVFGWKNFIHLLSSLNKRPERKVHVALKLLAGFYFSSGGLWAHLRFSNRNSVGDPKRSKAKKVFYLLDPFYDWTCGVDRGICSMDHGFSSELWTLGAASGDITFISHALFVACIRPYLFSFCKAPCACPLDWDMAIWVYYYSNNNSHQCFVFLTDMLRSQAMQTCRSRRACNCDDQHARRSNWGVVRARKIAARWVPQSAKIYFLFAFPRLPLPPINRCWAWIMTSAALFNSQVHTGTRSARYTGAQSLCRQQADSFLQHPALAVRQLRQRRVWWHPSNVRLTPSPLSRPASGNVLRHRNIPPSPWTLYDEVSRAKGHSRRTARR